MSKINTNMAGVTSLYHLRNKEEGMNKALERISSGLRLNHAVDDAAGASIVNRMTSQIKGLEAAIRNAADAISLTQTAEGAIEEVTQILHRMRELSVQSANGVYTGQDRQAIQNEVGALQEELHRIAESSTFNGVKMLNGSFLDTTFQVGFQPNDTATLSIEDVKPTGLGEFVLKTHNVDSNNMLTAETSVTTGTSNGYIMASSTFTANMEEAFEQTIGAPTASSSGTKLERFMNIYAGGTFTISGHPNYTIDASTGLIKSNALQTFDTVTPANNVRTITRTYTKDANIFEEKITLNVIAESNAATNIVRSGSTTLNINTLEGLELDSIAHPFTQSSAARGVFSAELAAFVDAAENHNSSDGVFSLSGNDAGVFQINSSTGVITYTGAPTAINADKSFNVVYTAANGDKFVETVTLNHDAAHATYHESTVLFTNFNAPAAFDTALTTDGIFSAAFDAINQTGGATFALVAATTDVTIQGGNTLRLDGSSGKIDAGDTRSFEIRVSAGGSVIHTEKVSLTSTSGGSNTLTRVADDGPGTPEYTAATNVGVVAGTPPAAGPPLTNGNAAPTHADGDNGQVNTAISINESARLVIKPEAQSSNLDSFKAANTGGTFTLAGADAALFGVDATTGELKSHAFVDFENPGDADANNVYEVSLVYTHGTGATEKKFTELMSITVTDNTADNSVTQAAARPRLGTDKTNAASLINEDEDITIFGNVGTKVIDVNGGASAYEIVQAINAQQGETGVYAAAQTRVNLSFADQDQAKKDTVTFNLYGKNTDTPFVVSANVDFGVTNGRDASLRTLADAINSISGKTGITAKVSPTGAMVHMFSNEGYDIVVENFTTSVLDIPMQIQPSDDELNSVGVMRTLNKGTGNNDTFRSTGQITFHSPYIFSVDVGKTGINGGGLFQVTPGAATLSSVAALDVLTVDGAKKMLTAVDGALVRIDLERSDLGAVMSRMEHTINNLSNIVVNTKAARSRIQDADIAEETTEMTKAQVLSQAAQAMLAQANRTSQSIMTLLQG